MNRVRWTRCFEPGCIQIRGEREPNEAKKRKESLKSKKNEKISLRVAKQTVRLLEEQRLTSREDRKKEKRVECRFDAPSYTG